MDIIIRPTALPVETLKAMKRRQKELADAVEFEKDMIEQDGYLVSPYSPPTELERAVKAYREVIALEMEFTQEQ